MTRRNDYDAHKGLREAKPSARKPLELYVWLDKDGNPYPNTNGRITAFDNFITGRNYSSDYSSESSPYTCVRLIEVPEVFRNEKERDAVLKRLGWPVPKRRADDRDYRWLWIALVGAATALALWGTL